MMSAATRTAFRVPCPLCGAAEGLCVRLHTLSLFCEECGEEVARVELQRLIDEADRLLRWLDAADTV